MTVRGMRSLKRKVRNMKDLEDNVGDVVREGTAQTTAGARANVMEGKNVWTMNLWRSIYYTESPLKDGRRFKAIADTPYARFVEFGTGSRWGTSSWPVPSTIPHYSSPELTRDFVSGIQSWVYTKPYFVGPRNEAVVWGIIESIVENGTHAHPFMRPAWFKQKPQMLRDVRSEVRKTVRRG